MEKSGGTHRGAPICPNLIAEFIEVDANGKLDVIDATRKLAQLDVKLREGRGHLISALCRAPSEGSIKIGPEKLIDRLGLWRNFFHGLGAAAVGEPGVVVVDGKNQGQEWL